MVLLWMGTTSTLNTQPIRRQYKLQPITMEETTRDTTRIVHERLVGYSCASCSFRAVCGRVEVELVEELMKSFQILLNYTPDLACRNLWLKSEKVSLFLADSVSFSLV